MAQQIKLLGLQAAEKRLAAEQAAALKREGQDIQLGSALARGLSAEELKKMEIAGKLEQEKLRQAGRAATPITLAQARAIVANPDSLEAFASGGMDRTARTVEEAINLLASPTWQYVVNPQTDEYVLKQVPPGPLTEPVQQAIAARRAVLRAGQAAGTAPAAAAQQGVSAPTTGVPQGGTAQPAAATSIPMAEKKNIAGEPMFQLAEFAAGPSSVISSAMYEVPYVGGAVDPRYSSARSRLEKASNDFNTAFRQTARLSEGERKSIEKVNELVKGVIDNPDALRLRLADLDLALLNAQNKAEEARNDPEVGAKMRQEAEAKVNDIKYLRAMIGFPRRAKNRKEVESLPPGTFFFYEPTKTFVTRGEGRK
jgi:hypothetical protein